MKSYLHPYDLPQVGRLAIYSFRGLTDLVEDLHCRIAGVPAGQHASGITGLVYGSIRGVTDLIDGTNAAFTRLIPEVDEQSSTPEREAVLAALNGIMGDYLEATNNRLAIPMQLRRNGRAIQLDRESLSGVLPEPGENLLVLVHGLCRNDLQWNRGGQDHGAALAQDLGFTPIYLRYNSGRHISTNGAEFAGQLEELVNSWPVQVEELVILAHSMGGLVARSAYHSAEARGLSWPRLLRKLVFLGTPHHGSPVERGGNWLQAVLGISGYTAPFTRMGKIRSAGITDMRHGSLLDEDWIDRDRFDPSHNACQPVPLPQGIQCFAIGAATCKESSGLLSSVIGDGLVPLNSALGKHADARLSLAFPEQHQWIGYEMNHLDLLSSPDVYKQIQVWLGN